MIFGQYLFAKEQAFPKEFLRLVILLLGIEHVGQAVERRESIGMFRAEGVAIKFQGLPGKRFGLIVAFQSFEHNSEVGHRGDGKGVILPQLFLSHLIALLEEFPGLLLGPTD